MEDWDEPVSESGAGPPGQASGEPPFANTLPREEEEGTPAASAASAVSGAGAGAVDRDTADQSPDSPAKSSMKRPWLDNDVSSVQGKDTPAVADTVGNDTADQNPEASDAPPAKRRRSETSTSNEG